MTTEWHYSTLGYSSCYWSHGCSSDCQGILSSKPVRQLEIHRVRVFADVSICEMMSRPADSPSLWNSLSALLFIYFCKKFGWFNSYQHRIYETFSWGFLTTSVVFWILTELYWWSVKFWFGCWGSKIWGIQSWGM